MKKRLLLLFSLSLLVSALTIGSCKKSEDAQPATAKVTYDANGGRFTSRGSVQTIDTVVKIGDIVPYPDKPSRVNYVFKGWCEDRACTIPWAWLTKVEKDLTLYARWEEEGGGGGGGGGGKTKDYIDLGLPSGNMWRKVNFGAKAEGEVGDYYAWGELMPYYADGYSKITGEDVVWRSDYIPGCGRIDRSTGITGYDWHTYCCYYFGSEPVFHEWANVPFRAYYPQDSILRANRDVATVSLGGQYRIPGRADWEELLENTAYSWQDSPAGIKVESVNGKSILFPVTGYREGSDISEGDKVYFWTSTYSLSLEASEKWQAYAICFTLIDGEVQVEIAPLSRCFGMPVRTVYTPSLMEVTGEGIDSFSDEDVSDLFK